MDDEAFFVYMDILGFKNTVKNGNTIYIYNILHNCIRDIKDHHTSGIILSVSDSIFFKSTKFKDVIKFIKLMYDGCINDLLKEDYTRIPFFIRGAISYGKIIEAYPAGEVQFIYESDRKSDSINALNLLGEPIIDATELCEKNGMKGARIAIHKSILNKNGVNEYKNYFKERTNPYGEEYIEFLWPALSYKVNKSIDFSKLMGSVWNFYKTNELNKDSSKDHYLSMIALLLESFENNREISEKLQIFLNSIIDEDKEKRNFLIKEINFLKERDLC